MGDRANCIVRMKPHDVYLYTHWGGYDLALTVQRALARGVRWRDHAYLTRIIFDAMTDGDQGSETGNGISTSICDNEHKIIAVDPDRHMVEILSEYRDDPEVLHSWTLNEFVNLDKDELQRAYLGGEYDDGYDDE